MRQISQGIAALLLTALPTANLVAAELSSGLVTEALSAETRTLLIREMQAIAASMGNIHTAVVTGDHVTVAAEARKIHDSFVLEQELTEAQRAEIRTSLPAAFVATDRAFHVLAEELARAGERGDPALERFWFEEMTRTCQACHREHAAARFPGLAPESQ